MQPETGWSTGQRALLRFLEQQGILAAEPTAPESGRPSNADLFAAFAAAIDQQGLVDLVSQALKIGSVELVDFTPMPDLVALIPVDVARRGEVVPIAQYDGTLEVAAANPLDLETLKSVEFTTGLRVRTKIARRADVCRAVCDAYGVAPAADAPGAAPEIARPEPSVVPPAADVVTQPLVDAGPDESAACESPSTPEAGIWSFEIEAGEPATDPLVPAPPVEEPSASWVAVDGDASDDEIDAAPGEEPSGMDPVAHDEPTAWSDATIAPDDAPELGDAEVRELGLFDDVRLDDPGATDGTEGDDLGARPDATEGTAPELDVGVAVEDPAADPTMLAAPAAVAPVALDRPAVVVVSRDLARRVAIRDALETGAEAPCILTMRDEVEARAAIALGRIAAVVVEGGALASDGRPLWEALRECAAPLIVWGGRPMATDVVGLDRDTNAAEVAGHVRALLGETVDD